jgi:hypothetical protein
MGDLVRTLTEEGIRSFREYLASLRAGATDKIPRELLTDAYGSAKLQANVEIETRQFRTRLIAGAYLYEKLQPLSNSRIDSNVRLWSWLSLYYFDELCPMRKDGSRRAGEDCRYILDSDYRRYYRHLLLGPYTVYRLYEASAPLLLWEPLDQMGEAYRELSCRQNLLANRGIVEAANALYYDEKKAQLKKGAGVRKSRAGSLRRFIDVMQQLDLTYDLYSMTGGQVLDLLPTEFDDWKKGEEASIR